ncbi:phage holin family protein [Nitriliruptoraceae bacterium ZYF776]|nr:phage holin family protein [Profundirhabdus halotolerans]
MGLLVKVIINAAALWVAVAVIPGLEFDGSPLALLGIALVLGVVNVVVKPLLTVLSLPLIIVTLGLFLLVVNGIALAIVIALSGALDLGLTTTGFGATMLGALVVSLVAWGLETVTGTR